MKESLEDILDLIKSKTGYMLYLHAGGRPEYGDFGEENSHIRAVYNLPAVLSNNKKLETVYCNTMHGSNSNYNKLKTAEDYATILVDKLQKEESKKITKQKEVVEKKIFGLIKNKKTVTYEDIAYFNTSVKLNELGLSDDEDAYILTMTVKGKYPDSYGRLNPIMPTVNIIGSKSNIEKITNYLKENPQDYYKLIEGMFPSEKYPNTRKNVIDKCEKQSVLKVYLNNKEEILSINPYLPSEALKEKKALMENPVFNAFLEISAEGKYGRSSKGNWRYFITDGVPLEEIIEKVNEKDLAKFPKILQLIATSSGIKVTVDSSYFNNLLFRSVNGHDGDRACREAKKTNCDIIKSYIEKREIFSRGGSSQYATALTTTRNPYVAFSGDRWGPFISPFGHTLVLEDDKDYKLDPEAIPALEEVVITSDVPLEKVRYIYMNEENAKEIKEYVKKSNCENCFGKPIEEVIIAHPWRTFKETIKNGLTDIIVLTANSKDLAEPRYKSLEEFKQVVEKAKKIKVPNQDWIDIKLD